MNKDPVMSQEPTRPFALRALMLIAVAALTAFWVAAPAGCFLYKDDPLYCPGMPNNTCVDTKPCKGDGDCDAPKGVCDVGESGVCVECTASAAAACVGNEPVCGAEKACRGCSGHGECGSGACLPDGACGEDSNVAYVGPTGSGTSCTRSAPCKTVDAALKTNRPYVKFVGTTDEAVVVENGRVVTFLAEPGAKLTRSSGGAIVTVRDSGTSLKVYDLSISDAPNNGSGYGVLVPTGSGAPSVSLVRVTLQNNPGGGISVSGGTLRVEQSTVSGNAGGGISVSGGTFDITNSFIVTNGNADQATGSEYGGLSLSAGAGAHRLERNTVAYNHAKAGTLLSAGVACSVTNLVAGGNIVTSNNEGLSFPDQTKGACTFGNSYVARGTEANTLMFKSITTNPPDFHLTAGSPASVMNAGGTCTGVDIDGDARPQPADGACDLGADEYKAN